MKVYVIYEEEPEADPEFRSVIIGVRDSKEKALALIREREEEAADEGKEVGEDIFFDWEVWEVG